MRAAAIVMPMAQDGAGFGRALETVLRERPCRVIVESIPAPERSGRRWRRSLTGDGGRSVPGLPRDRGPSRGARLDRDPLRGAGAAGRSSARRARHRRASPRFSRPRRRAGLGSLYLLAVLAVAIRRGQLAALVTAVLGVLDAQLLLHRPAPQARDRALAGRGRADRAADRGGRRRPAGRGRPASARAEAESRARVAAAREREAKLLAEVASAILAGRERRAPSSRASATGWRTRPARGRARVVLEPVPSPRAGRARRPAAHARRQRLAVPDATTSTGTGARSERVADPLGRLIDVAVERERVVRAGRRDRGRRAAPRSPSTAILHAISHDLRSPLTAITTAGSALRDRRRHRGRARRADRGDRGRERAAGQARRRPARPVADPGRRGRAPGGLVRPARRGRLRRRARCGTEHPIEFPLPAELPLVRADAAQLERVFSNLIENAIKFSPPGVAGADQRRRGRRAGRRSGSSTAGSGIPAAYRSQVFEPFFRGRGDARRRVRPRARDLPGLRRGQRRPDRAAVRERRREPRSRSASRSLAPARERRDASAPST